MHDNSSLMHVSANTGWNVCVSCKMLETWKICNRKIKISCIVWTKYILLILFGTFSSYTELVEKVFLKIVLADTDKKLEKAFATFLAPVLLKLGSSKEVVKNKVNLMN